MSKFVIFASARTGSTSLAELLDSSKDVKLCFEPFNPDYSKWNPGHKNYYQLIKDKESLNKILDELLTQFTSLKVLDYQLPEDIYCELLLRKDLKIIFLRRKNLLELGISDLIAHQVKEWRKIRKKSLYKNLNPIDIKELEKKIKYIKHLNNSYADFLKKNRKNEYLPLWYEELYSEDLERNIKTLKFICEYLDISPPSTTSIKKYMTPSKAKINFNNIYKNLPNYKELLNKFTNFNITS